MAKNKLSILSSGDGGHELHSNYLNLFDDDLQKLADRHFKDDVVTNDNIQKYSFDKCLLQAKKVKISGKKSVRFSFLMIGFTIGMRLKVGADHYDFIAKTFNLPSNRTINDYVSPSTNAPYGILYESISAEKVKFDAKIPDCPIDSWLRKGALLWDSMSVKEKLFSVIIACT